MRCYYPSVRSPSVKLDDLGENKITGCVRESFRLEPSLNFKRDEEAIFKVLNVSFYKIDLTDDFVEHQG